MLIDAFSLHFPSAFLLWLEDSGAKTYLEGLAGWNSILKASQYLGLVKSLPASQYLCLMIRLLQILPVWTCLLVLVLRLLFNGLGMWRALRDSWKLQRVVMEMLSVSLLGEIREFWLSLPAWDMLVIWERCSETFAEDFSWKDLLFPACALDWGAHLEREGNSLLAH